jgi:hypothetical protein
LTELLDKADRAGLSGGLVVLPEGKRRDPVS